MSCNNFSIVFLVLIISLSTYTHTTLGENHVFKHQGLQTYIVRIQNNLKSSNFENVEEWYKFILSNKLNANPNDSLLHVYKTVFNGFSARLRPDQVHSLKALPEVIDVIKDKIYQVHTTRSPYFLDLKTYHSPMGLLKDSELGSNVVVGVLDTGIWPESPSFSDEGMGPVPAHFKGVCKGGENFPPCNKKIVGVRYMNVFGSRSEDNSARDKVGHGTHTASIIAGRTRADLNCSFFGYAKGEATGIAPNARLAIYKVCWSFGCIGADVLLGIDKAVEDGVDIISLSLGGKEEHFNNDVIAIGAFGALQKGVIVSASAGNSGPDVGVISNTAPWITTIGASTIDRTFPADLILDNGESLKGTSLYTGTPLPNNKTFPLVYFSSNSSQRHCLPDSLNEKDVKGKIVICAYMDDSRVGKSLEVKRAGGEGVIVALNDPKIPHNDTVQTTSYLLPGLTIPFEATHKLLNYLNKNVVKQGTILFQGTHMGENPTPVLASFSSRGPNLESKYVLKPDLIAPGVDILAAWPSNLSPSRLTEDPRRSEFNILSGTSMSCPHVSGVLALLKGAHPNWTPAMLRSALMTTSYSGYHNMAKPTQNNSAGENKEFSMSLYDTGAGHVDPEKANNPGLVLDINEDDYIQYLCASNYSDAQIHTIVKRSIQCQSIKDKVKQWDINYPAVIITDDSVGQNIIRSLTNVDSAKSSYIAKITSPKGTNVTVTPHELSFNSKGEKKAFSVKVISLNNKSSMQSKAMGSIIWTDGKHNVTIHLMVA